VSNWFIVNLNTGKFAGFQGETMKNQMGRGLLAGVTVFANAAMAFAGQSQSLTNTVTLNDSDSSAKINLATKGNMERSWLNVPQICKAKGFAFEPVRLERETLSPSVLSIHSALESLA
jgi:hypothetical protein